MIIRDCGCNVMNEQVMKDYQDIGVTVLLACCRGLSSVVSKLSSLFY